MEGVWKDAEKLVEFIWFFVVFSLCLPWPRGMAGAYKAVI